MSDTSADPAMEAAVEWAHRYVSACGDVLSATNASRLRRQGRRAEVVRLAAEAREGQTETTDAAGLIREACGELEGIEQRRDDS